MRFNPTQFLLAVAPIASAFPAAMLAETANDPALRARAAEIEKMLSQRQAGADAATGLFEPINTFNAQKQLVNVSRGSGHEYVPPGPNDLRGPCPGLNAFANHNFLPHNGYASVAQYIDATTKVVGMGPLLATFLSALGGALDGDLLNWSIGGTPSLAQGGVTGQLGNGLSGSHNKYEGDASPTRPDLYEADNNYRTVAAQFQQLIDASPGGVVTLDSLTAFRSQRFDTQIKNNPEFFNGPFTGVLVQPAAAEFPAGRLDYATIQSWFGINGQSGSYTAAQGGERIPENWYRRALEYPYETTYFLADLVNAAALHPKFLDVGGNTGTTNSFTGVDVSDLTGGVFNTGSLLQGNNLACYVYQLSAQAKPDILLGALNGLTSAIGNVIGALGCPRLQTIDANLLKQFPGYTKKAVYG
ncbi:Cloroperoxidase [Plenodomus tracheiphilus IPT5]|uniref:Cloroperoxidase n=1 Tax=Plenodomus tracheiphilus IPT5 TaxID=1408161 RepID=A0A6A7B2L0_9PLEO|nr:Cloroperoxidase [Plenodomus tracheiphilus IPT5]